MAQSLAFLSYTRKDDEFFGGYITAFRKMLENAVHVVTGDESFQVFQDVDGIVIGEKWQKKLNHVIHQSSLFVPMLSPLFFSSKPCTEEVQEFLKHERSLKRDDLILPIYFLSSPRLEKDEEKAKDPIAQELASRQMVDWRQKANVPLAEPAARVAVLELAGKVAEAVKRTAEPVTPEQPKSLGRPRAPARAPAHAPVRGAVRVSPDASDPRLGVDVPESGARRELTPLTVLWVDDKPQNNKWERRAFEEYGMRFTLAKSTSEARKLLSEGTQFAAIISDMGRPEDPQAGLTLLKWVRNSPAPGRDTPYFIYTSPAVAYALSKNGESGLRGITGDPDALVDMVLAGLR